MKSPAARTYCTGALSIFLILVTVGADARLIRGGGRGSAAAPVRTGEATYLLPTSIEGVYSETFAGSGSYELPADFDPALTFPGNAKYDFNEGYEGGWPVQSHLNWGQDCEEPGPTPDSSPDDPDFYDCYFALAADEVFEFSGHAIGLPEPGDYPGNPMLDFTWVLETSLGDTLETWGRGDPEVTEGALLAFDASVAAGCFAVFQPYTSGYCQTFDLNTGLTGADLLALSGGDGLRISLGVSIEADAGFAFYNYVETPSARFLQRGGSLSAQGSDGLRLGASSVAMRIEVPVPATGMLFAIGVAGLCLGRRRVRRRG